MRPGVLGERRAASSELCGPTQVPDGADLLTVVVAEHPAGDQDVGIAESGSGGRLGELLRQHLEAPVWALLDGAADGQ